MSQRPPASMTEWKWEDVASTSAHSSVKKGREKIASASAEYRKADALHSHTRVSAETLGIPGENQAPALASNSHHDRTASAALQGERKLPNGMPDSDRCASVMRKKPLSFAPDSPRFLPPC